MIFYGTKGSHLKSEKISGAKCTNCNEQTSHTVNVFGRYGYLYWIPVFPLTKKELQNVIIAKLPLNLKK